MNQETRPGRVTEQAYVQTREMLRRAFDLGEQGKSLDAEILALVTSDAAAEIVFKHYKLGMDKWGEV